MLDERSACRLTLLRLMPYSLLHFLIKKRILEKYVNNTIIDLFAQYQKNRVKVLAVWIRHSILYDGKEIIYAFIWEDTPEGRNFWEKIHREYQNYLRNIAHN